mmetsp:Transcript_51789/g.116277  ORF Transcript_51789/g.116277 Transcript_51789/m.116277 type:complete len:126 (-) Transcript_51789:450-827(-)
MVLRRRLGFVRLALEHGVPLVPVYTFGDDDLGLRTIPGNFGALSRLWLRSTGIALPFVVPCRRSGTVVTVIGQPVHIPHSVSTPFTAADVDDLHRRYLHALSSLYERNVSKYGGPNAPSHLSFVE